MRKQLQLESKHESPFFLPTGHERVAPTNRLLNEIPPRMLNPSTKSARSSPATDDLPFYENAGKLLLIQWQAHRSEFFPNSAPHVLSRDTSATKRLRYLASLLKI